MFGLRQSLPARSALKFNWYRDWSFSWVDSRGSFTFFFKLDVRRMLLNSDTARIPSYFCLCFKWMDDSLGCLTESGSGPSFPFCFGREILHLDLFSALCLLRKTESVLLIFTNFWSSSWLSCSTLKYIFDLSPPILSSCVPPIVFLWLWDFRSLILPDIICSTEWKFSSSVLIWLAARSFSVLNLQRDWY